MQFFDKDWASVLLRRSTIVHKGICYLAQIVLTPDLADNCQVIVYDSTGTSDNEIVNIRAWSPESRPVFYIRPFKVQRGLYVLFDDYAQSVQVVYKPIYSDKETKD